MLAPSSGPPTDRFHASPRFAVVSTPRSANTWVSTTLADYLGLTWRSAFTPGEVDWHALPERYSIQIHWPRTARFQRLLDRQRAQVVVLVRHPLDTLISIMQFAHQSLSTAHWAGGAGGNERSILGALPSSTDFVEYAVSKRARLLLSISEQWWGPRAVACIRFEDLIADPAAALRQIATAGGIKPVRLVCDVVAAHRFERLQAELRTHYWQGQAGLWRKLLTADVVEQIAPAYERRAKRFGYDLTPDPQLTDKRARAEWHRHVAGVGIFGGPGPHPHG